MGRKAMCLHCGYFEADFKESDSMTVSCPTRLKSRTGPQPMDTVFNMSPLRALAISAILLPFLAIAQDAPKIDQATALKNIEADLAKNQKAIFVPGVSLAIIKDDKIILMKGYGYKDVAHKKPVTPDTLFAIGSTSKAFTSMLMAMAVDEGKVSWKDSPKKYLPYFRMHDPETDKQITINDILSHRSGLPRTDFIMLGENLTPEDLIWNVTRATPTAKLGEKWQYQNIMFVAAGEIEKTVFGKSWTDLVQERILNPLGMKHTNMSVPQMIADYDHSLGYDGSPQMNELPMRDLAVAAPAGAINSSARDMAEWVRFLLRNGELDGKSLVSKENFDEIFKAHMTIVGDVKYGYGWMLHNWHGHKMIEHGGNIDGFNAQVAMMPDQHLGLVMLTNVSGSPLPNLTMESVWKNLVGMPADAESVVALKNPDQEVGSYTIDQIKLDIAVTHEGSKLFAKPAGQPKMEMIPVGDRRYKIGPPAPDKVYLVFSPDTDNPKQSQFTLEQSGMKFVGKQAKPYVPTISVDDLMAKEIAAMGGAENMAKIKTMSYRYAFDMETQGLKITGLTLRQAPNAGSDLSVYTTDSGRRIAWDMTTFDGTRAKVEASYSPMTELSGASLDNVATLSTMWQELNWKTLFPTTSITGTEKVNGDEAYVLSKKTKSGMSVTDYISTTTFKLVKRTYAADGGPVTDIYKEYKEINGVLIPVTIIRDGATTGKGTVTVTDIHVNEPLDQSMMTIRR